MNRKFEFLLCGYLEYEDIVIDIRWGDEMIGILDQEKGPDHKEIELSPPRELKRLDFSLNEFKNCLNKAERYLDASQKYPDDEETKP